MKQLNEMNNEQLTYLQQKWSVESMELDRGIIRAQERLNSRVQRQVLNQAELAELQTNLANAEQLLTHLQSTSAPQEMIDNQQELVDKLQMEVDTESRGANVLTDEEAFLQQVTIDELRLQKQYRTDKIAEINNLLLTDA